MKVLLILVVLSVIGIALVVVGSIYYNKALTYEYYQFKNNKISKVLDGKKWILLSDLHGKNFGKHNKILIQSIAQQKPEGILIAGDLVLKGKPDSCKEALIFLKALVKICPVYYAPGNHETRIAYQYAGIFQEYLKQVEALGVVYLSNKSVYLEADGEQVRISGLDLEQKYYGKFYENTTLYKDVIDDCVGPVETDFEILLAHNPTHFPVYAEWGADLVCAGHVHGGIVILPFIGGLISTTYELFPTYDFGMFQEKNATMILSRGLGVHSIPLRLFNKPEISVIHFQQGRAE